MSHDIPTWLTLITYRKLAEAFPCIRILALPLAFRCPLNKIWARLPFSINQYNTKDCGLDLFR
jgi:hypothetical protein